MRITICVFACVALGAGGIARAHPAHVDAKLVCSAHGHRLADGDRKPIDHDVTCEIDADPDAMLDGDLSADMDVAVAQPLGGATTAPVVMTADGGGWRSETLAVGNDLPRCADATFHAALHHDDRVVWESTLHLKPSCPKVRFAHAPKLVCDGVTSIWLTTDPDPSNPDLVMQAAEDRKLYPRIECKITVEKAPEIALLAYFRRTPPAAGAAPSDPADRVPTIGHDFDLIAIEPEPIVDPVCTEVKVDAVLVRDGGVVWTGHDHYTPKCPNDKPH
jgi:hypothetical protein